MNGAPKTLLYERLVAMKPRDKSLSEWAKSAGLSRQAFTDLKNRGSLKHESIDKLLRAAGYTWADFDGTSDTQPIAPGLPPGTSTLVKENLVDRRLPRDIPVLGTAEGAAEPVNTNGQASMIETIEFSLQNEVEWRARPTSLATRRDVYALYVTGDSMIPRHDAGDLIYVDPHRPPSIGDDVVLQLRGGGEDGSEIVRAMIKRLVRRGGEWVELEQFNPPMTFKLQSDRVARMHRVLRLNELV